jgi:hypothetical protein
MFNNDNNMSNGTMYISIGQTSYIYILYYIIYYCLFDERYIVMLDRVPTYIYITSTLKLSSSSTSSSSAISFARV